MDRRNFFRMLGSAAASIAMAEAIPFGRVWSFPSKLIVVARDYYSIEWPVISRQWGFGAYVNEVLDATIFKPQSLVGVNAPPVMLRYNFYDLRGRL